MIYLKTTIVILCLTSVSIVKSQSTLKLSLVLNDSTSYQINEKNIILSQNGFIEIKSDAEMELTFSVVTKNKVFNKTIQFKDGTRYYTLNLDGKNQYKLRYRDFINSFNNAQIVYLKDYSRPNKPKLAVVQKEVHIQNSNIDSVITIINNYSYEFERVNASVQYLSIENSISSKDLILLSSTLNHDYSKWQIFNEALTKLEDPENYKDLYVAFKSEQYQERISDFFNND